MNEQSIGYRFLHRLDTRLVFLFVLLSTIPFALSGFLAYKSGRRAVEQQVFNHLISTNLHKSDELERWINANEYDLEFLAQRPLVRELAALFQTCQPGNTACREASDRLIANHLRPAVESRPGIYDLMLLRAEDGLIVVSTDPDLTGKYREKTPFFLNGLERTYTGNVSYFPSYGQVVMHVSTPVFAPDGEVVAVLVAYANLEEMSEIIAQHSGRSESEDTYLVNAFNFFVTEPRFGDDYALTKALHTEGVDACLNGESGAGYYLDYRQVPIIGAYRWLPDHQLCILTEVDQAEVLASVVSFRNTIVSIGVGAIIIVAFLGVLFSGTITGPIKRLTVGAREIGQGNLDHRIPIKSEDEIGQLAAAFNQMAADLHRSLGETAQSRHTVLALSQAAEDVQRARTPEQVYQTVADRIAELGHHAVIFSIDEDGTQVAVTHMSIDSGLLRTAEKLAGVTASEYRRSIRPGDVYDQIITRNRAIYVEDMPNQLAESLPSLAQPMANRIVEMLGLEHAVYAPLTADDRVFGVLLVVSNTLTEAELPAVSTFANQTAIALENTRLINELRELNLELEKRVEERTRELKRSNEDLEQFAYVASHDLQEPLRMVASYLQLLERRYADELDSDAHDFIDFAVDGARRMKALINDLLAFSRVGTRGKPFERTDMNAVLGRVRADLHALINENNALLTSDELPTLPVDETQISQVFQNLISNAIKFRKEDVPPRIHVGAEDRNGEVLFSVRDNGIGIDPQFADRIFVIFQRLHNSQQYDGTGIGLAISKRIVERHGGEIWVESQEGAGATFYFTLPKHQPEDSEK
jgi:signal transduction histidine kinase